MIVLKSNLDNFLIFSFLDHDLNKSNLLPEELEWNLFVVPLAMVNT